MARAAFLQNCISASLVSATTIQCQYSVLYIDTDNPDFPRVDNDVFADIPLNGTTGQIEIAIRDAIMARGTILAGTAWLANDVYQFNLRRG